MAYPDDPDIWYEYYRPDLESPCTRGQVVQPGVETELINVSRTIYVAGIPEGQATATLDFDMPYGDNISMTVAPNSYHPIRVSKINASTDATVVAFW